MSPQLSKGDYLLDVSHQLGHADVTVTAKTYAHWIPSGASAQVAELDCAEPPNVIIRSDDNIHAMG